MAEEASRQHLHDEQYIQVLRGIIEGSKEYIAAVDTDVRLIAFNRAYREEFRKAFRRDVHIGDSLVEVLSHLPEQRDALVALWRRALSGEHFSVTAPFGPEATLERVYEITFNPLKDWLGRPLGAALTARDVTERTKAEQALRRAESEYRSIFENVSEGVFRTSVDGVYLSANDTLATIYGYESARDLISSIRNIRHQLYADPSRREEFGRLMADSDVIRDFESQIIRKDGARIWISENAHAVRDENGEVKYYEGTVQDISSRKRYELALLESEILYHSLVESLPVNIFRKDLEDRFTFANQRFCASLNLPLDQIVGRTDYAFFPEKFAAKYQRDDRQVMETREPFEEVEAYEAPDGSQRHVHVLKTALVDHNNNVIGIQGLWWDETERKRAEQELAHERDLLRSLLDNVPDRIAFKDTQSRFIRASRALAARLGLASPDDVVGKTDFDFHPRERAEEYFADEQRIVSTGEPVINKVEHQVAPGRSEAWASVTKVPIRNSAGVITGLVGLSRDITELKRIEDELQAARDEALELARQKSQFLAMMSHEIRTPMNGILGMAELLTDESLNERQSDFVETIRSSTVALLTIINDILDFSKIEAGKLVLSPVRFDLREMVENTAELLQGRADQKGIELVLDMDASVGTRVVGDPGRLRQVLTNLLGNAIKFTDRGEVIVRLSRIEEGGGRFRFEVADSGIGIPEDVQQKIFSAFTQADGSTTRRFGGTGLGLAISKQLVDMMGGSIGVHSVPDQGSTFWFEVPLEVDAAGETAEESSIAGVRVLLIKPNATQARVVAAQLMSLGAETHVVSNWSDGEAAVAEADQSGKPFDVVVCSDRLVPAEGLSGRMMAGRNASRFVLLTGQHLPGETHPSLSAALTLSKPIRLRRLEEVVARAKNLTSESEPDSDAAAGSQMPAETSLKRLKILLAEDNAVNRKVALRQLEKLGLNAETVVNGREVVERVRVEAFDVVLMDCQMPEMDGFEATRQVREFEKSSAGSRPPAYIVAMTANALVGDREECLGAGMDDYIVKPVEVARLREALLRAAGELSQAAEPAPQSRESSSATCEWIDAAVLDSLGDRSIPVEAAGLAELIDLYIADAALLMGRIESGIAAGAHDEVRLTSHTLKGSSTNLGARRLAAVAGEIEAAAKSAEHSKERELLPELRTDWESTRRALEEVVSGMRPK